MFPRGKDATLAAILHTIMRDRPSTQKEIAEKVGVSRRYVTELLRPLAEKGAVKRIYTVDMAKLREEFPELLRELGSFIHEDVEDCVDYIRPSFDRMMETTLRQLRMAVCALENEPELADKIIKLDEEVNRLDEEIRLYTRTIPATYPGEEAGKMATILLEISHCVERIGDYACNMAEVAKGIGTLSDLKCWDDVKEMADIAVEMAESAYDLFDDPRDFRDRISEIKDMEKRVHELIIRASERAMEEGREDPDLVPKVFGVARVTKDIERVADKSLEISELVRELYVGVPRDIVPEQEVRTTVPLEGD